MAISIIKAGDHLPRHTSIMPNPTIIPAAVSSALCESAVAELGNAVAVPTENSCAEYQLTTTCTEIAREAHKVSHPPIFRPCPQTEHHSRHMALVLVVWVGPMSDLVL